MAYHPPASDEKKANIRKAFLDGMPVEQISKRLHMKHQTVRKIVAGLPDPHGGKAQVLYAHLSHTKPHRYKNGSTHFVEE